jgi:NAD-dependent SIR2 family protein deacetylase
MRNTARTDSFDGIAYYDTKKGGNFMEAYCVKCKAKKEMKSPKGVTMKNKKPATTGTCPTCGTKMFKIGKSK